MRMIQVTDDQRSKLRSNASMKNFDNDDDNNDNDDDDNNNDDDYDGTTTAVDYID